MDIRSFVVRLTVMVKQNSVKNAKTPRNRHLVLIQAKIVNLFSNVMIVDCRFCGERIS